MTRIAAGRHLLRPDDLRETLEPVVGIVASRRSPSASPGSYGVDLERRLRQRVEERRLAGVGQADEPDPEGIATPEADPASRGEPLDVETRAGA
jgi:hypothetical protein